MGDGALGAREMPGYKSARIACAVCGEGINYDREVRRGGEVLCQGCADLWRGTTSLSRSACHKRTSRYHDQAPALHTGRSS